MTHDWWARITLTNPAGLIWYRLHENLNTCFDTIGEIDFTARARRLRSWLAPCQELQTWWS